MSSIREFYDDKSIFVTGGLGFMGKVLLVKLLTSCSKLRQIFILIREKRGKSPLERINELGKLPIFQSIMKETPSIMKKLVFVCGDICFDGLGLSPDDSKKVISETNIIFHLAATVTFDTPFKRSIEINTLGTQNVIELAKQMPQLIVMLHVSTAYCYVDFETLTEEVRDTPHDAHEIISLTKLADADIKNEKEIMSPHPNNYTFTKRLAEILVRDEYPQLPVCIARPSIVTPSYREPLPGWVDNLNGPVGFLIAGGKGLVRSMLCDGTADADLIPVDYVINGFIAITWEYATKKQKPLKIPVYNVTVSKGIMLKWEKVILQLRHFLLENPYDMGIWYPSGGITSSRLLHYYRVIFTQMIPAFFLDGVLFCLGKKRFLVKLQAKIRVGMRMLQYFTMRNWIIDSKNLEDVRKVLSPEENAIFFTNTEELVIDKYMKDIIIGSRIYCLKEKLSSMPKARSNLKILKFIDAFTRTFCIVLLGWIFSKFSQKIRNFY